MYNFYFDSGTTNSRAYLLDDTRIVGRMCVQIGSRDAALQNDSTVLVRELRRIYDELLARHGLSDADVNRIYMSGMISCPHGLIEIEHLSTPVSYETLASGIIVYNDTRFFLRNIYIVPGIKTLAQGQAATLDRIEHINNMRGEETEIMGVLHRYGALCAGRAIILLPGSHTQVAFLRDGVVENILSTITGELYSAILNETILSSALSGIGNQHVDSAMVQKGYEILHKYGFNRALYIVRSMLLFTDSTLAQRHSYIEGVLNGGVMDAIISYTGIETACIAVAGTYAQYEIFTALSAAYFPQLTVTQVPVNEQMPFSVEGILHLICHDDAAHAGK